MASQKETAAKVQDLLTVCLAKAFDFALISYNGGNWFQQFKVEEENERFPIPRENQKSIHDCDFQAMLKILYYRPEYARKIFGFFGREEAENPKTFRRSPLYRTLGRLINDYRNDIAAHVSSQKIQEEISGEEESVFYDYPDAIRDMTSIAKVFEAVKAENGKSYYELILKEQKEKNKTGLIIGIIAGIVVVAAVGLLLWKPWNKAGNSVSVDTSGQQETPAPIDIMEDYTMNADLARDITGDFFGRLRSAASSGDIAAFGNFFDRTLYSEEDIQENYQNLADNLDKYESEIAPVAFTDTSISALQFLYSADGKESGTNSWFLEKSPEGWIVSAPDEELSKQFDLEMEQVFGEAYSKGYCSIHDYQTVFQKPVLPGLNAKLRSLYRDGRGDLIAEILIFNGTDQAINEITMSGIQIKNDGTKGTIATVDNYGFSFDEPLASNSCRYFEMNLTQGENQKAAWTDMSLKNSSLDLKDRSLSLSLGYDLIKSEH